MWRRTTESVTAPPSPDSTDDADTNVSVWWWIGGVFVATAAVLGIGYSLRRRSDIEDWAREASVTCDIGRALSFTLTTVLDDATDWSRPARYTEQDRRFTERLTELGSTVPDLDFPDLLAAVGVANDQLRTAVSQLAEGSSIATARASLQPAIDNLAAALTSLEHEATIVVFGASLPSSRTTG